MHQKENPSFPVFPPPCLAALTCWNSTPGAHRGRKEDSTDASCRAKVVQGPKLTPSGLVRVYRAAYRTQHTICCCSFSGRAKQGQVRANRGQDMHW